MKTSHQNSVLKLKDCPPNTESPLEDMDRGPEEIDPVNHPRNFEIEPSNDSENEDE